MVVAKTKYLRHLHSLLAYKKGGTDLQYNRARWYDPAVGRWLSEDPIGFEAGDANLSRYVSNSPTMRIDPSGLLSSDYTETAEGQQAYAQWYFTGAGTWNPPPENWDPTRRTWGENLYNYAYGYSDFATVGMGPLTRYVLGYDTGIDRSDPSYWFGFATPVAIVTGASPFLASGLTYPVFGTSYIWTTTTSSTAYTTIWGYNATLGLSTATRALLLAEQSRRALLTVTLNGAARLPQVVTQMPRITYNQAAANTGGMTTSEYLRHLTQQYLTRYWGR